MAEQMTTHQSATTAQAAGIPSNVARVQYEAQHSPLPIITIQQAQSTQFRTLELETVNVSILSLLSDIKNLIKLKEINNMKLSDANFHE